MVGYSSAVCWVEALLFVVAAIPGAGASSAIARQQRNSPWQCRPAGPVTPISELPEASGIAVSLRVPGRLWALNDSGPPLLFALDTHGSVTGRVRLLGATVGDWEAVAVGRCPSGSCIYVGNIGDNDASRKRITIYRVQEPAGSDASVAVKDIFHATYPDGAQDAEALLVAPDGQIFIVTKGDTGAVAMYRFPKELRAGATHQLERIGTPRGTGKPAGSRRITDGTLSGDGQWVVLRTGRHLVFHASAELMSGNWREVDSVDLKSIGEVQGEGVAVGADGTVYLAGEGGGKSRPGSFARLACTVDR